jgi:hypothetical protein
VRKKVGVVGLEALFDDEAEETIDLSHDALASWRAMVRHPSLPANPQGSVASR